MAPTTEWSRARDLPQDCQHRRGGMDAAELRSSDLQREGLRSNWRWRHQRSGSGAECDQRCEHRKRRHRLLPPGEYAIYKVNAATATMLDVTNKHDITFLGDGMASQVRMAGDQGGALSILFLLRNTTSAIQFRGLFMDAALASNTSEQNHLIQIQGLATDPAGSGARDIDITGCYFGEAVGDAVRLAGDDLVPVTNVRIR